MLKLWLIKEKQNAFPGLKYTMVKFHKHAISHLCIQRFLDADPPLNPGFSSLNLCHYLLNVLKLIATFPENSCPERYQEINAVTIALHIFSVGFLEHFSICS